MVVVWGAFPQRVVEGDRIVFVHGDELAAWLRARPATRPDEKTVRLAEAVRALSSAA